MHVLGAGFVAHEDHVLAALCRVGRGICREVHLANGCTGRCSEPPGNGRAGGGKLRVQHRIEVFGSDAHQGFLLGDAPLALTATAALGHLHCHAECCGSGAFPHARLQHPQLAVLDGELRVAHVLVVVFQTGEDVEQFGMHLRELALECVKVLGVANTRHHILTLGVHEVVAVGRVLPRGRVTGETHARAGLVVAISEDHRLNVHRSAEVVADLLAYAVGDCACAIPRAEDGLDCPT